jgi:DNA-binding NtrC family response regulator/ligand-binding sensor domain-containing protein
MPPLARLSFWIPPDRTAPFEGLYHRLALPFLRGRGWQEAGLPQRPPTPGVCSRLFAIQRPEQIPLMEGQLRRDPGWLAAMTQLSRGLAREVDFRLEVYAAPAEQGRRVEVGRGRRQGLWHTLGVRDGLPSSLVTQLLQDRRGSLWVATYGAGVCCYDGARFHAFSAAEGLAQDQVFSLLEDRQGRLWFGTESRGVSRWDGARLETFTRADGLASNCVWSMLEDRQGRLWLWESRGLLSCLEGGAFRAFGPQEGLGCEQVSAVLEDRQGRLWIGTWGEGVCRWDGRHLRSFTRAEGLAEDRVRCLLEDPQGNLWIGTESRGVSRWDGKGFTNFTTQDGLASDQVSALGLDAEGGLWLAGKGRGLSRWDGQQWRRLGDAGVAGDFTPIQKDQQGQMWFALGDAGLGCTDGAQFHTFTTAEGLGNNQVRALLEDRQGNLWAGTWGGGISRCDQQYLRTFTTAQGLGNNRVEALLEDREGKLWAGTWGGGVSRWDGQQFCTFTTAHGLAGDHLWCLYQDREGRLWLGTFEGGVSCWDGKGFTTFTTAQGLGHNSVWCIFQDRAGRLWFGTQGGGASCWDGERFTTLTTAQGLPDNNVWAIAEDHAGALWFSTFQSGVSRYQDGRFQSFTTADGLAHDQVWCMMRDRRGRMWFGTWGGGVSCWDGRAFTTFAKQEGLADNNVRSLWEDREGHLWFGTFGGGVSRWDGLVFQTFSRQDGLVHDAVQAVLQDQEGRFWIATEDGITRYVPPRTPPAVHFRDLIADQRYGPVAETTISASQRFVLFEFQGASFTTAPDQFAYIYRLRGVHEEWRTTRQQRAEYRDLPVGAFIFQVCAVDKDLNYSEPTEVRLNVGPDTNQDRLAALQAELGQVLGLGQFIGRSRALEEVMGQLHTAAPSEVPVLILGETGTGKGLAARALHHLSRRRERSFIQLNCGALPEGLVASELFGHEKGAFTGATGRKLGRFELADGGTLFLDEIGDLPLDSQRVLLQVLQDGTFQRVGGQQTLRVDVRVVAATNRDLKEAMRRGQFREDLFYRLNAFVLELPPLRRRREDLPLLVHHFAEQFARHLHRPVPVIETEVFDYLSAYDWPGNVRELEHLVQRALLVCRDNRIRPGDLPVLELRPTAKPAQPTGEFLPLDEQEKQVLQRALRACNWVVYGERGAARLLGIHPERLRAKMRKYGLRRPSRRSGSPSPG